MAGRQITDKSGKRIAEGIEITAGIEKKLDLKIPHLNDFDLMELCKYARDFGHYSKTSIYGGYALYNNANDSAYLQFLHGMSVLSNYESADGGRVAFATSNYLTCLHYEMTLCGMNPYIGLKDGKITQINNCQIIEAGSMHMPGGAAFLILSSDCLKGLNELDAAGMLNDRESVDAFLDEHADGLYFHGEQKWIRMLDVTVEPGETNKIIITMNQPHDDCPRQFDATQNQWWFVAADYTGTLPYPEQYNAAVAPPVQGEWRYAFLLDGSDATKSGGRVRNISDRKFEVDVSNLSKAEYGGMSYRVTSGMTAADMTCFRIIETLSNGWPVGGVSKYYPKW